MNDLQPKPFVFVLMPFNRDFDDVYRLGIKAACEQAGAYAERVDEQVFEGSILQRIYNQISKADLIVADMTGKNANVFYETGYAHALGKPVILLTQSTDDIPFDLKHHTHIVYNARIVDLLPELQRRVRHFIENPTESKRSMRKRILVRVNEVVAEAGAVVCVECQGGDNAFQLVLEFHNRVEETIETAHCQVGLITPLKFIEALAGTTVLRDFQLGDDARLHLSDEVLSLLPGAWERLVVDIVSDRSLEDDLVFSFVLRLFASSGFEDHPFTVRFAPRPAK